jgi:hypothetical protein
MTTESLPRHACDGCRRHRKLWNIEEIVALVETEEAKTP